MVIQENLNGIGVYNRIDSSLSYDHQRDQRRRKKVKERKMLEPGRASSGSANSIGNRPTQEHTNMASLTEASSAERDATPSDRAATALGALNQLGIIKKPEYARQLAEQR